jgi:feruloyl esterase
MLMTDLASDLAARRLAGAAAWALAACIAGCGGGGGGGDGGTVVPPQPVKVACADLASAAGLAAANLPVADTRILSATPVPARLAAGIAQALPAHCEVTGRMAAHTGIDGQSYATTFRMRLPLEGAWNGRFYMQGGGATDGVLGDAIAQTRGNPLVNGYAVISTDSGHDNVLNNDPAAGGQQAFGRDPQARTDFFYNALEITARTGKALVKASYGRSPDKSYFFGCSNGGRQGMMFSQRFPAHFDGIVAGAPAFRFSNASVANAWSQQEAAKVVDPAYRQNNSLPDISRAFSDGDLGLVKGAILSACDALDGLTDDIVGNVRACTSQLVYPQLDALSCGANPKSASCLSAAQIDAVKRIQLGPVNSSGQALYAAWPWDPGLWTPVAPTGADGFQAWAFAGSDRGQTLVPGYLAMVASTPPVVLPTSQFARYMLYYDFDAGPAAFCGDQCDLPPVEQRGDAGDQPRPPGLCQQRRQDDLLPGDRRRHLLDPGHHPLPRPGRWRHRRSRGLVHAAVPGARDGALFRRPPAPRLSIRCPRSWTGWRRARRRPACSRRRRLAAACPPTDRARCARFRKSPSTRARAASRKRPASLASEVRASARRLTPAARPRPRRLAPQRPQVARLPGPHGHDQRHAGLLAQAAAGRPAGSSRRIRAPRSSAG